MEQSKLHPIVLKELLGNAVYLIDRPAEKKETVPIPEQEVAVTGNHEIRTLPAALGGYAKGVLIIVNEAEARVITDDDLNFLSKVLSAVKLSMEDVMVINLNSLDNGATLPVTEQYEPSVALLFGIAPETIDLPMRFPEFQVQPWGKTTFLLAPDIKLLNQPTAEATEKKRLLWQSLQRIFLQ